MKKCIALAVWLLVFCMGTALAAPAKRVVLLPLETNGTGIYAETAEAMEIRLEKEFHVPLNGTLHIVELVPEAETEAALAEIRAGLHGRRVPLADWMKPLAEKLQADIVAGIVVTDFWEYQHVNWRGDTWLESRAGLTLIGYDKSRDNVIERPVSRWFRSEYSPDGTAPSLAMDGLEEVLQAQHFAEMLRAAGPAKK